MTVHVCCHLISVARPAWGCVHVLKGPHLPRGPLNPLWTPRPSHCPHSTPPHTPSLQVGILGSVMAYGIIISVGYGLMMAVGF